MENYKMTAIPTSSSLLLSYKLEKGVSDQSYGLFIAKMAGVPEEILRNAEEYMKKKKCLDISEELKKIDVNSTTPIQALEILHKLQQTCNNKNI